MTATLPEASRLVDLYPAFRTPTRRPTRWNVRWPSPTPTPWSAVARLIERADWLDETDSRLAHRHDGLRARRITRRSSSTRATFAALRPHSPRPG
jgi:hypothetical protein